ncbi:MAG: hypothetical protein PUP91_04840 [Rhizonema sp. PD37]|nr:hypothetical protein [Rhizonema sp. PD37]
MLRSQCGVRQVYHSPMQLERVPQIWSIAKVYAPVCDAVGAKHL